MKIPKQKFTAEIKELAGKRIKEGVVPGALSREPGRVVCQRTQQAQECAKAPFDHRRLLDAGYALVVS